MSKENPPQPTRNSRPGVVNALLLCVSVVVILGIYGYSIFDAKKREDAMVLAPTRPAPTLSPADVDPDGTVAPTDDLGDVEPPGLPPVEEEPDPPLVVTIIEELVDPEVDEPLDPQPPEVVVVDDPMPPIEAPQPPLIEEEVVVFDEEEFLATGWKIEASDVLRGFMAAESADERSAYVLESARASSSMRAMQQDPLPWGGLEVQDFKHIDLSEADRRKGIFLMLRETPVDGLPEKSSRSYAFFKRTENGLKLDFEILSQTTGKAFQRFIERPQSGVSRIFRVFIAEDPNPRDAETKIFNSYFIAGLSDFSAATRVRVTSESPVGKILAAADFTSEDGSRRIMRNATVELRWTDQPENSAIELSRFICWEFLGLGGEPLED
jgi:hypothetical protein